MPRAFVTGAGDFVGLNLIAELRAQGWDVLGFASETSNTRCLENLGVDYIVGDISSLKDLRSAMPEAVDAVFHAVHDVSLWSQEAEAQTRANVNGTRVAVCVALEKFVGRFIHTSSVVAYGLHLGTVTEETPTKASSSNINFVRSKAEAEAEVRKGIRKGLDAVIINPANIIGPYDFHGWSRLFRMVDKGRMPVMAAGGGSFCHSRSMAKAQIGAFDNGRTGANYLLGGVDATYVKLLAEVGQMMQRRVLPRALPKRLLEGMALADESLSTLLRKRPVITRETVELLSSHTYCKSLRAQEELGYKPASLAEMLADCREWLKEEGLIRRQI